MTFAKKIHMARVHYSKAGLRIIGDELIPAEISRALGAAPTHAQTRHDRIVGKNTGQVRIAQFGMWRLRAADREPEDLNGQIEEILSQLTQDLSVWQQIATRYKVDLFCGIFMENSNEGMQLSPESLSALGSRGIEIDLDIYGGTDEEEETTSEQVGDGDAEEAV